MEEQPDWRAHAGFMNELHAEGLIVVGGPLSGTPGKVRPYFEGHGLSHGDPMDCGDYFP
jgi:hypothetical protein